MKILIVSSTVFEIAPLLDHFEKTFEKISLFEFSNKKHTIYPLITGVGQVNTALGIGRYQRVKEVDVLLHLGIAGAYDNLISSGEVVEVVKDRYGDFGVEQADGSFTDIHELELIDKNYYPFIDGWLHNEKPKFETSLKKVTGLTVNKVSGSQPSIDKIKSKYKAEIETMESAAMMQTCKIIDVKFNQFRAISNHVEPRNKDNWKIDLAITNLNNFIIELLDK